MSFVPLLEPSSDSFRAIARTKLPNVERQFKRIKLNYYGALGLYRNSACKQVLENFCTAKSKLHSLRKRCIFYSKVGFNSILSI